MAPVKRKSAPDERPKKKARTDERKEKEPASSTETKVKPTANSILQQEDRAFPRGGGGVLTAIEKKQIEAQAERDALFEEESGVIAQEDGGDGELFDTPAAATTKKQKRKSSGRDTGISKKSESSGIHIQGLSYKNLVVGSSVLGRVTAITGRDIALALPNNLTGYVPITAISERLTVRIEKLLADEEKDEGADDDEDIDLKELFHQGQWLRATVTAMGTDSAETATKSKKHIELSLDPSHVNGGLAEDSFVTNCTLQASVRSVEDHGLIMDLGLSDDTVKGFVSKKELGSVYSLDSIQEGQVLLCLITGKGSNGKVLKLACDPNRFSVVQPGNKQPTVSEAPTVDAFQAGTAVDVLVTEVGAKGVVCKIMGMLDVTADVVHSGATEKEPTVKVGSKIKARIVFSTPQKDDGTRRVGVSILDHVLALTPSPAKLTAVATAKLRQQAAELQQKRSLSSTIEDAEVTKVIPDRGIFLKLDDGNAFAHISQLSDSHIDSVASTTGPYKPETKHKARIIGYNPVDNVYYVSLKPSVLDQTFLRLEDVNIGEVVKGTVDKLILGPKGVTGVLVKLSENVTGLVPEMHLSDAHLQHPERKYREGFPVKCRVLSVDTEKRHLRLTLKKSIVEGDGTSIWKDYKDLSPEMESNGTIINLLTNGAVVQYFGPVRAWLPVAEMSDTFIEKPQQHFRLGQTVKTRIVSLTPETQEMKVSCKDRSVFGPEQQKAWDAAEPAILVNGTITEKTAESVLVDLENGLKGMVNLGHLVDGSQAKAEKELKRIRVGQKLTNVLLVRKLDRSRTLLLSNKPALIQEAQSGNLIKSFATVQEGRKYSGFVRNVTSDGVYVEFANEVVGLLPKSQISPELLPLDAFGMRKDQTVVTWVTGTDTARARFILGMKEQAANIDKKSSTVSDVDVQNPIDSSISSMSDFTLGQITKARVVSAKATQVNVRLADNVQGRIDVSEAFDSWEEMSNKSAPLEKFKPGDMVDVKILGIHDARNHRFLPISHRQGKVPVFELSAKKKRLSESDESLLTFDTVKPGASYIAFVNNHAESCVWVNLSPNVRGRVALMDLSDDVGQLQNVANRFRIGCALRVKVKSVDVSLGRLDLTARETDTSGPVTLQDLSPGQVLPARITKTFERSVHVQISDAVSGVVPLVELSDDYDQTDPTQYTKNDVVRVCVLAIDLPNKKVYLSLRPSKVLSSSLPVKDASIIDVSQLKAGDLVRGFVKQVADKGVFVSLGARVDALVRISDLSDQFIKDWKTIFQVDQLVHGRVVSADASSNQVQLSLKKSHVDENYTPPLNIHDLQAGTIVTGKVRKVEDFGAFIDIDNTQPRLSGLCHRSEVAARRVEDVRKLYSSGDVVKAIVLKVDVEARKISLGLKASYFDDESDVEEDAEDDGNDDVEMEDGGVEVESDVEGGVDVTDVQDMDSSDDDDIPDAMDVDDEAVAKPTGGLKTSGFNWSGGLDADMNGAASESEYETTSAKKRKRKPEIKQDLTGDLDKNGPQSVSDFERQLIGRPNNSGLWVQYMAFQLGLGETQKARDVAERALRMIHIRETEEKANVWIAWLNLEVAYGDQDSIEDIFKRACQVQDPLEMHEKLASIYIDSGKQDKADSVFERIAANKSFRASPDIWVNYASFLMEKFDAADRARALLSRALQSVPTSEHRLLTAKFAALEFRSSGGDAERGRTIFEGLVSEWPKWSSGWDMWVDLERSRVSHGQPEEKDQVRQLYERMVGQKMKKRRAKFVFKRWLEFEEQEGDEKQALRVKALAKEYAERLQAGDDGEE